MSRRAVQPKLDIEPACGAVAWRAKTHRNARRLEYLNWSSTLVPLYKYPEILDFSTSNNFTADG